ncbi:MAG: AmmeMemoRadiSam system protein A [Propionibacteriaceae bacterium]|nr:AmmeMemoRadiSam system protein A [Propionibacteriaceae bacterium]
MNTFPDDAGLVLVGLARSAIASDLGLETTLQPEQEWLTHTGASFVTLRIDGHLRGCIGSLMAYQSLEDDVRSNAVAAAFEDPRFPPLSVEEFDQIHIDISILSAPEPMTFTSKQDALDQLRPGIDGVIILVAGHRATFLPQVWEELPEPEEFMAHLMRKAGQPMDHWDDHVRIERYQVTAFEE